jgi:hypothetical protein
MEWLRRRWRLMVVSSVVLGVMILLLAPHYNDVQRASDAEEFRQAVADDGRARTAAAASVDMAFAVSYALLAAALSRRHVATRVGAALVALGAACDVVENSLLLVGVAQYADLDDSTVDTMRRFGAFKWVAVVAGGLTLAAGLLSRARDTTPSRSR